MYGWCWVCSLLVEWKGVWPIKISHQQSTEVILWDSFSGTRVLTWNDPHKNWSVKQKLKIEIIVVAMSGWDWLNN